MAISTIEVVLVLGLGIVLLFFVWAYFTNEKYAKDMNTQSYTRGANLSGPGNVNLGCDSDSKICVYSATQICTTPDSNNFENSTTDGMTVSGTLNPNTTTDLTSDMATTCNGQTSCTYSFTGTASFPNGMNCSGQPHLIATYTCIPKNQSC